MIKKTIIIFLVHLCFLSFSQSKLTKSDVRLIEENYQKCLDKGEAMLQCTVDFYNQMDSCVSLSYIQALTNGDNLKIRKLKTEHEQWTKKCKTKFKEIDRKYKMEGRDGEMIRLDAKAKVLQQRVFNLLSEVEN